MKPQSCQIHLEYCAFWQCWRDEAGIDLGKSWDRGERKRKFCHMAEKNSFKNQKASMEINQR